MRAGSDPDWLGDLRWKDYPHLEPQTDVGTRARDAPASVNANSPRGAGDVPAQDPRVLELARENEALRARLEDLARLAAEFERRLSEAGNAYESAMLESESHLRNSALEREKLSGELEASKSEASRLSARDATREAELRLERERRGDAEKALLETRRRLEDMTAEVAHLRNSAAQQSGALAELRRQAEAQNDRLMQSKALTDQDVRMMRQDLGNFLTRLEVLKEMMGESK